MFNFSCAKLCRACGDKYFTYFYVSFFKKNGGDEAKGKMAKKFELQLLEVGIAGKRLRTSPMTVSLVGEEVENNLFFIYEK